MYCISNDHHLCSMIKTMSEKLCLQWNDFKENVNSAFGKLRDDKQFTDITLVCEDGQQMEAHKVILASSSPFFEKILQKNNHPQPLIYLRGVKSEDLVSILDFFYFGKANVYQESLDSFLAIAEDLKVKGLTAKTEVLQEEEKHFVANPGMKSKSLFVKATTYKDDGSNDPVPNYAVEKASSDQNSGDLRALDEKVKSLMERSENLVSSGSSKGKPQQAKAFICKVCGKEGRTTQIRDHIEANHLERISILCNYCDNVSSSRSSLSHHKNKFHK